MVAIKTSKLALAKQACNYATLPDSVTGDCLDADTAINLIESCLASSKNFTENKYSVNQNPVDPKLYVEEAGFLCRKVLERNMPPILKNIQ